MWRGTGLRGRETALPQTGRAAADLNVAENQLTRRPRGEETPSGLAGFGDEVPGVGFILWGTGNDFFL